MALSKIYRLPSPELPDPAKAPENFQALAQAVENQAFPSLQAWDSYAADILQWSEPAKSSRTMTIYSANLPSTGIVGWVDVDVNVWGALTNEQVGTAGMLDIKINGVTIRQVRWHNWWRIRNNCVYNSVRWPNINGVAAKVDIIWNSDAWPSNANVFLICFDMSYQIYGKKVI